MFSIPRFGMCWQHCFYCCPILTLTKLESTFSICCSYEPIYAANSISQCHVDMRYCRKQTKAFLWSMYVFEKWEKRQNWRPIEIGWNWKYVFFCCVYVPRHARWRISIRICLPQIKREKHAWIHQSLKMFDILFLFCFFFHFHTIKYGAQFKMLCRLAPLTIST